MARSAPFSRSFPTSVRPLPVRLTVLAVTALLSVGLLVLDGPAAQSSQDAAAGSSVDPGGVLSPLLGDTPSLGDVDRRVGRVAPTTAQKDAVGALGAKARWTRFGTPESLIRPGGWLAQGMSGSAPAIARTFLREHADVFNLTAAQVDGLSLLNIQQMAQSSGRAVLFQQRFGGLPAAVDGLVTVGVQGGKVAYVSSSVAPTSATPQAATIDAADAWRRAAADVGRPVAATDVSGVTNAAGWVRFTVAGFAQAGLARQRALPAPDGSVRRVWEVDVQDTRGGAAFAYTSYVDASTGRVLVRRNQVDASMYNDTFSGTITATTCGPLHPFTVDAATKTIVVGATAAVITNDIVVNLILNGATVASSDTATSPEAITYSPAGGVPAGVYNVQVCPFPDPTAPFTAPGDYTGVFSASEQAVTAAVPYPPKWKYFLANPVLNYGPTTTDSRKTGCWVKSVGGVTVPGCDDPPSPLLNLAARGPWDYNFRTNTPTFTTEGNAAVTAEAWTNPLAPGAIGQRPVSPSRLYPGDETVPANQFTDAWNNSKCNPLNLVPGGNDILPAVSNLFSTHNRLHDWAYFLGFTEENYNLQDDNFGNRADGVIPTGGEGDPELGQVQAGALDGGTPTFEGRDNANQITLQDGVPGITNQYLFQPIAGAFYAPCTDGDLDVSIVGHEYNHAISNRMIGGPDNSITSYQGGSMGESWGDQVALEYLFEHGYSTGVAGAVEGPYATGNRVTGIRNYALDKSPLQYGDLGYDVTGPEVHADGEPWSAAMWAVRQALVTKYDADYPSTDVALQRRCSEGDGSSTDPRTPLPATQCPGNRRWAQLLIDSYLLQQAGTSMLDARDAMLAADMMRFGGANQAVIANTFASRGLGAAATTASGEDDQPKPDYTSAYANEGTLTLTANEYSSGGPGPAVKGTLYVGDYEARVTPSADTDPATPLSSSLKLVPGTYRFVFQAPGYGLTRFTQTITAGQTVAKKVHLATNLASGAQGAAVDGASAGSLNPGSLIDDTEATNWAGVNPTGISVDTPTAHPFVNIDLAGDEPTTVRSVKVSAMLRPAATDDNDADSGSRFTALRDFAIATCTQSATSDCSSTLPADTPGSPYTTIFDSTAGQAAGAAAFDSTVPRPLAPNLIFKLFDVPDTSATHVRLIALENQCSGAPEYAGEQDNDPLNSTDCKSASDRDESVRAAELEVYPFDTSTRPPGDPVVTSTLTGPATAKAGTKATYTYTYTNLGPKPAADAVVTSPLPQGVSLVSANRGGTLAGGQLTWHVGTVAVHQTGSVTMTLRFAPTLAAGTVLLNEATLTAPLTFSPPAEALTTIVP